MCGNKEGDLQCDVGNQRVNEPCNGCLTRNLPSAEFATSSKVSPNSEQRRFDIKTHGHFY